jgi:hypothetical protein
MASSTPAAQSGPAGPAPRAIPGGHEPTSAAGDGSAEPGSLASATEPVRQSTAAGPAEAELASALPHVLRTVGSVVAPTSLLTALFIHFGMMDAIGYFRYFGVNITVLNLPFYEYLTLSSDSAVVPLIYLAAAAALGVWIYQLPVRPMSASTRRFALVVLAPASTVAGLALVGLALADVLLDGGVFPVTFLEGRGLSLSIGILLLGFAGRLRRVLTGTRRPGTVPESGSVARTGVLFLLVSVGLFWAVGNYAFGVGETRARGLAAILSCRPDVVVYSEKSLNLSTPGIRESIAQNPDTAYRFRYDGLKLVPQSGSQYVLLPNGWTPENSIAIVVPRTPALRLEFSRSPELRNPGCR